jgi:hypothetical protein
MKGMNEDLYDHLKRLSNEEHTHGIVAIRFQNLVFFLCIGKETFFGKQIGVSWGRIIYTMWRSFTLPLTHRSSRECVCVVAFRAKRHTWLLLPVLFLSSPLFFSIFIWPYMMDRARAHCKNNTTSDQVDNKRRKGERKKKVRPFIYFFQTDFF